MPKIGIVGTGAVGGYYGCMLARSGCDVHFIVRSGFEHIAQEGFEIRSEKDNFFLCPAQVYRSASEIGPCDLVIVGLKATANDQFEALVKPLLHEKTEVLTLQNGMGNAEALAQWVPADRIQAALCFVCINRLKPGVIENYLPGYLSLAPLAEGGGAAADEWVTRFTHAGVKCNRVDSLDNALWHKLCWNIPFNGLAIVGGGITTDKILESEPLKRYAHLLMLEVRAAAAAAGYTIDDTFIEKQFRVTVPMGAYKPSSLIDYLEGRDVEIEAIWGEPLRRGKQLGVNMPYLESLYLQILHWVDSRE